MTTQAKTRLSKKLRLKIEEINFDLTPPNTPQKNDMIEQIFATLYSRMRLIIAHTVLHENLKTGIWIKCAENTTNFVNIVVKPHRGNGAYEKL